MERSPVGVTSDTDNWKRTYCRETELCKKENEEGEGGGGRGEGAIVLSEMQKVQS